MVACVCGGLRSLSWTRTRPMQRGRLHIDRNPGENLQTRELFKAGISIAIEGVASWHDSVTTETTSQDRRM